MDNSIVLDSISQIIFYSEKLQKAALLQYPSDVHKYENPLSDLTDQWISSWEASLVLCT